MESKSLKDLLEDHKYGLHMANTDVAMIYLRIGVMFDHMIIKDCYEAGMMTEEAWKSYLKNMMCSSTKEDNNDADKN